MKVLTAVGILIAAIQATNAPADPPACNPADPTYVCGLQNAEDLVRLTGTPWVVASHFNVELTPPFKVGFLGPLSAARIDTHEVRLLYPTPTSSVEWDKKAYPDCARPPVPFSSHGLNVKPLDKKRYRLYVANHGARQSVEVIDIDVRGDRLLTTWRGCILAPAGIWPNGLVPLPGGGVALSGFGVAVWRPGQGWRRFEGLEDSNGIEVSKDGRWLFVDRTNEQTVVRVPVEGGNPQTVLKSDFYTDNLRWGEDGRLYVAGGRWAKDYPIMDCFKAAICDVGFVVVQIDPVTLATKEIIRSEGFKGVFGLATTALQVGDYFWLGSVHGDRVAILSRGQ